MKQLIIVSLAAIAFPMLCIGAGYPNRIVSLAPSITESLYQLGREDAVIATTVYCPKGTRPKESIGTLLEPNIEKIASLSPDLVIISKEGNRQGVLNKLQELGIPVYVIEEDRSFDSICDNYLRLARVVGREKKAIEIIAQTRVKLAAIQCRIRNKKPLRVFWEVGARPLFTISRNSFINDFNTYVGAVNLFNDINLRYPKISREEVIKRNPDAIILVAMGDVTKNELDYWKQFQGIAAVRDRRLFVVEMQEIYTPTPPTFLKGVELIANLLHPVK